MKQFKRDLTLGITIASSVFFFGMLLILTPMTQEEFRVLGITVHILCAIVAFGVPFISASIILFSSAYSLDALVCISSSSAKSSEKDIKKSLLS